MATERPATQAKRILVVEDEPMIRMLLEDMLGELGYTSPRYPRHAVRLCHGLRQRARALSGSADADEAVSDRGAQANATERARIAVVSTFFCVGDTWGRERGAGRLISAPLAFLEDEG